MSGLPKPKSTIDIIKSRRQTIDDAERAATGVEEPEPPREEFAQPRPKPAKGLPKPGVYERVKKFFTGERE